MWLFYLEDLLLWLQSAPVQLLLINHSFLLLDKLLIAAALDQAELESFLKLAHAIGFDALVEIHDEAELERAVAAGADLIGVNQRDLVTFAVDTDRAVRMAPQMPAGVVRVAESGITGAGDAAVLAAAGYHAVLVGEHLVTSGDPEAGVAALRGARRL